jgi:hypothetical protein
MVKDGIFLSLSLNINNAPKEFSGEETGDGAGCDKGVLYPNWQSAIMPEESEINRSGMMGEKIIDIPNLHPRMSEHGEEKSEKYP